MRRRWRITKVGWVIIGTLAVCALLITVATGAVRFIAGGVAGIILLMLASEGFSGEGDMIGSTGRKHEALMRDRFGSRDDR